MSDNIKESFEKEIEEKFESPFYGIFIIYWCLWNWKILYITFSVSEKIIGNKLEYIEDYYNCDFYSICLLILFPFLSSFFSVYFLPWAITTRFYIKKVKNDKIKKIEKIKAEKEVEEELLEKEKVRTDLNNALTANKENEEESKTEMEKNDYLNKRLKDNKEKNNSKSVGKLKEEEIIDFFNEHNARFKVFRIAELLIKHNNIQDEEWKHIRGLLYKLKNNGYIMVENKGDPNTEEFYTTPDRIEKYKKSKEKILGENVEEIPF